MPERQHDDKNPYVDPHNQQCPEESFVSLVSATNGFYETATGANA